MSPPLRVPKPLQRGMLLSFQKGLQDGSSLGDLLMPMRRGCDALFSSPQKMPSRRGGLGWARRSHGADIDGCSKKSVVPLDQSLAFQRGSRGETGDDELGRYRLCLFGLIRRMWNLIEPHVKREISASLRGCMHKFETYVALTDQASWEHFTLEQRYIMRHAMWPMKNRINA